MLTFSLWTHSQKSTVASRAMADRKPGRSLPDGGTTTTQRKNPFRHLKTSPEIIQSDMLMYVRFPYPRSHLTPSRQIEACRRKRTSLRAYI